MSILVAGVGNIFLHDDGFGVEVAQRMLARSPLPGAKVIDFGIRGLHLAYTLLEPIDLLVIADAIDREATPGSLFVVDPALDDLASRKGADAHGMDLGASFAMARTLGASLPPTRIVGCQPSELSEAMALSPPVEAAVDPAIDMIHRIIHEETHPHERSTVRHAALP